MVDLVEEWKYIEEHTQYLARYGKVGSCLLKKSEEGAEIKVRVGNSATPRNSKSLKTLN